MYLKLPKCDSFIFSASTIVQCVQGNGNCDVISEHSWQYLYSAIWGYCGSRFTSSVACFLETGIQSLKSSHLHVRGFSVNLMLSFSLLLLLFNCYETGLLTNTQKLFTWNLIFLEHIFLCLRFGLPWSSDSWSASRPNNVVILHSIHHAPPRRPGTVNTNSSPVEP
jgi:hypothetical protein